MSYNPVVYSETLETIVAGANIAGYMESEDKIAVDDDMTLTDFLVDTYNAWKDDEDKIENWYDNIYEALLSKFGCAE